MFTRFHGKTMTLFLLRDGQGLFAVLTNTYIMAVCRHLPCCLQSATILAAFIRWFTWATSLHGTRLPMLQESGCLSGKQLQVLFHWQWYSGIVPHRQRYYTSGKPHSSAAVPHLRAWPGQRASVLLQCKLRSGFLHSGKRISHSGQLFIAWWRNQKAGGRSSQQITRPLTMQQTLDSHLWRRGKHHRQVWKHWSNPGLEMAAGVESLAYSSLFGLRQKPKYYTSPSDFYVFSCIFVLFLMNNPRGNRDSSWCRSDQRSSDSNCLAKLFRCVHFNCLCVAETMP